MRSVARWCQHVYGLKLTSEQFLVRAHPLRSDPVLQFINDMTQWAAWVAKHGRVLGGLLQKLPRLTIVTVEGNERGLREVLAHALSLLPRRLRLTDIDRVHSDTPAHARMTFPFLRDLPEGLALIMAQGRLCHLEKLDLSRYGFWRFLRAEPHRILFVSAISSGSIPRLMSLSIDDEKDILFLLREAFQCTAAWQPSSMPQLVDASGGYIDIDAIHNQEEEEEKGEQRHPHRRRQAIMKRLMVRNRCGNYANILELLKVPIFSRLQSLELASGAWHNNAAAQIDALVSYIRSTPWGRTPYLRSLTINLGLTCATLGPLIPLLLNNCPFGLTHLDLTNLRWKTMQEFGEIYLMGGLATLTTLHITAHESRPQSMASWLEDVIASKRRGAALKELQVSHCATLELIQGLERGAFPQLEKLSICLENMDLLQAFVAAMGNGGAPCAHTLRFLTQAGADVAETNTLPCCGET